jgi:hypothetical protein
MCQYYVQVLCASTMCKYYVPVLCASTLGGGNVVFSPQQQLTLVAGRSMWDAACGMQHVGAACGM